MDGIHDMGGMHGFGPVDPEDEQVFHQQWERRVFAGNLALSVFFGGNSDSFRHRLERIPPARYLASSYYERWLAGMLIGVAEHGVLSAPQVDAIEQGNVPEVTDAGVTAVPPQIVEVLVNAPAPRERDVSGSGPFAEGDQVRARHLRRTGHNRLPRYARGRTGRIIADRGNHLLPDAHADSGEIIMQRLYTVAFAARELWGETAHPGDSVRLDLWESYLEPA